MPIRSGTLGGGGYRREKVRSNTALNEISQAINEITTILNGVRSGTITVEDRDAIVEEIRGIKDAIDRLCLYSDKAPSSVEVRIVNKEGRVM